MAGRLRTQLAALWVGTALALVATCASAADGLGCVGDCNADGMVTVDELIVGVNIALGNDTLPQCAAFDVDGNGAVTIDELVRAVIDALGACAAVPPSPSPTETVLPLCTPPLCQSGEVLYCPSGDCPGGCGVQCATPTPTPAATPTSTVTCAATGTPYCSESCNCPGSSSCFPCPTVRPNCLANDCGLCVPVTPCPNGEIKACPGSLCGPCSCVTVTPSMSPTTTP